MYTREEFVEEILYALNSDNIYKWFGVSADELKNGAWNGNLKCAYLEYSELTAEI